ncbi:MAG: penicillin-binding protein activator [Pseudomonadota bacterium]
MNRSVNAPWTRGVVILCFIALVAGCAPQKPVFIPKPEVTSPQPGAIQPGPDSRQTEPPSPAKILADEAESLLSTGQFQESLSVYNKVLESAEASEREDFLSRIQEILLKADSGLLEGLDTSDFLAEIKALIMYQQCQRLIFQERNPEAIEHLLKFIQSYPENSRTAEARKALQLLESADYHGDRIGCMLPLTGKFSVFGQMALKGVEVAVQDLSRKLGKSISIIIKDTQSDNDRAVQCVDEFYMEKVAAIVGPIVTAEAAAVEAQKLKIPMLVLTQKQLPAQKDGYVFTNFLHAEMQTRALVDYAFHTLGITHFAVLYPNDKYGTTYMNLFWDDVEAAGGDIVGVESYGRDQTDFSNAIKKLTGIYYPVPDFVKAITKSRQGDIANFDLRSYYIDRDLISELAPLGIRAGSIPPPVIQEQGAGPEEEGFGAGDLARMPGNLPARDNLDVMDEDEKPIVDFQAIFIPDAPAKVSLILPQLAYHDVTGLYLLGPNIWHNDLLIKNAAGYIRNAVITEGYFPDSKREKAALFASEFRKYYGSDPGFIEAVTYDSISLMAETALEPSVYSRRVLRDTLSTGVDYGGVTGRTCFSDTGIAKKELFFLTVQKGRFVEIIR